MNPNRQEVETAVENSIRKALKRELGPIVPETSITGDLGVDSLDFIEIVYNIEEVFDVEIDPDQLFPQRLLRDQAYVQDGKISAEGVVKLNEVFSFTSLPAIEPGTTVADITPRILTVRSLVDYVAHLTAQGGHAAE